MNVYLWGSVLVVTRLNLVLHIVSLFVFFLFLLVVLFIFCLFVFILFWFDVTIKRFDLSWLSCHLGHKATFQKRKINWPMAILFSWPLLLFRATYTNPALYFIRPPVLSNFTSVKRLKRQLLLRAHVFKYYLLALLAAVVVSSPDADRFLGATTASGLLKGGFWKIYSYSKKVATKCKP